MFNHFRLCTEGHAPLAVNFCTWEVCREVRFSARGSLVVPASFTRGGSPRPHQGPLQLYGESAGPLCGSALESVSISTGAACAELSAPGTPTAPRSRVLTAASAGCSALSPSGAWLPTSAVLPEAGGQEAYKVVPPYPQGIHSKTPGGCLKPQIVSNHIYTVYFPVHT